MKKRFARGSIIAIAMGMVLSGGAALAAGASPAASVKFKSGPDTPWDGTRFDGATVGGLVYFLGFRRLDNSTDGSIWTYDIKTGKYKDTKIDMPVPVSNYTIAQLKDSTGDGLYIFGGRDNLGETMTTVQVFYPKTGKTKVIKTDPWPGMTPSDCVSLPATGVAVVDNIAYLMGGMSFSTSVPACVDDQSKQVWSFDPKGKAGKKFKAQPSLKVARGYVTPAVVDGKTIVAIGGDINDAGTLAAQEVVEGWKVGSSKWDDSGYKDLPQGCDESQAFAFDSGPLGGTVTLAGCGQWPNALPDVLQYDVKKDKWSTVGALKEARRNQAGANLGSDKKPQLFVAGGYNVDGTAVLTTTEIGTPGSLAAIRGSRAHVSLTGGGATAF